MNDESLVNETETEETDLSETDLVSLVKRMQQQLNYLEKKIDILISQSQPKPFRERTERPFREGSDRPFREGAERPFRKKTFSRPSRSFDRPRPHSREEHESSPREREAAPRRFYDRFNPAKKRSAIPKKRPFSPRRTDRE
jgi:hypothetical protein